MGRKQHFSIAGIESVSKTEWRRDADYSNMPKLARHGDKS
jgi:hypothetical protein